MMTDKELDNGLIILKVVWFVMLVALALYLFVGIQIGASIQLSINEDTFDILRTVLYGVALVILIATVYIRKLLLSGKSPSGRPGQDLRHPMVQKYLVATVLSLAMSESIGILGLVLFLLGKNPMDLYLLILVSAAAMVMYRPRKGHLISLVQEDRENSATGDAAP